MEPEVKDTQKVVDTGQNFSQAFDHVRIIAGSGMRLPHWGADVLIKSQYPDENSKMTAPYLYVESRFGCVPWKMTEIELFSTEWEITEDLN